MFERLQDDEEVQCVAWRDWGGDDMGRAHGGGGGRIEDKAQGSTARLGGGVTVFFSQRGFFPSFITLLNSILSSYDLTVVVYHRIGIVPATAVVIRHLT